MDRDELINLEEEIIEHEIFPEPEITLILDDTRYETNEEKRIANENQRIENEQNRISNENERVEYYDDFKRRVDDGEFNGKDAKINGINTINIVEGDGINIKQEGSTLTIENDFDASEIEKSIETLGNTVADIDRDLSNAQNDIEELQNTTSGLVEDVQELSDNMELYSLVTETGSMIKLELDTSTYILKAKLYDKNDKLINTSNGVDLPLETLVLNISYDNTTKELIITLQNGTQTRVPVGELISGLVSETSLTERLTDYVKNTDYASSSKGGVVKISGGGLSISSSGNIFGVDLNYNTYLTKYNTDIISKGTLENVITGKELTNKTYVDGEVEKLDNRIDEIELTNKGYIKENEFVSMLPRKSADGTNTLSYDKSKAYKVLEAEYQGNTKQGLPNDYQEVEYIESTGTQYIDTGFNPNQDTRVEAKLSLVRNNTGTLFGCDSAWKSNGYAWYYRNYEYNNASSDRLLPVDTIVNLTLGKNVYIDDELINSYNFTFSTPYSISIFALHRANEFRENGYLKLYSFKIFDNDALVRDYIPCYRKSDNVVGLYDLVNDAFYTNRGTGTFTKGSNTTLQGPTPDYPQEVKTLKGWNLFDIGTSKDEYFKTVRDGTTLSLTTLSFVDISINNGNLKVNSYNNAGYPWLSKWIELEKNTDYTISCDDITLSIVVIGINSKENGTVGSNIATLNNTTRKSPQTFNSREYNYYYIAIYPATNGTYVNKLRITKGSQKPYLPYQNIGVKRVGKNLFDGETETGGISNTTGENVSSGSTVRSKNYTAVVPNGRYIFSNDGSGCGMNVFEYDKDKKFIITGTKNANTVFTVSANTRYIRWYRANNLGELKIQQELDKITPYEPYQARTDYIDLQGHEVLSTDKLVIKDGRVKLIKNCGEINADNIPIFTFREDTRDEDTGEKNVEIEFAIDSKEGNLTVPCNIVLSKLGYGAREKIVVSNKIVYFQIHSRRIESRTNESMIKFLKDNNFKFYYPLATPQEIDLGPVDIKTLDGTNNVEILATLEPTKMSETYVNDLQAEIEELKNALLSTGANI